jgi:hypothetical protein
MDVGGSALLAVVGVIGVNVALRALDLGIHDSVRTPSKRVRFHGYRFVVLSIGLADIAGTVVVVQSPLVPEGPVAIPHIM